MNVTKRLIISLCMAALLPVCGSLFAQTDDVAAALTGAPDFRKIIIYNDRADALDDSRAPQIYRYANAALELLKTSPNDEETARAQYGMARVGKYLYDEEMTIAALRAALNKTQKSERKYIYGMALANAYAESNRYEDALRNYTTAEGFTTDVGLIAEARLGRVTTLRHLGTRGAALTLTQRALNDLPSSDMVHRNAFILQMADIYLDMGRIEEAKTLYQEVIDGYGLFSTGRESAYGYYGLAMAAYRQNQYKDVVFLCQKAILAPGLGKDNLLLSQCQDLLSRAYLALNDQKRAFEALDMKYAALRTIDSGKTDAQASFFKNSMEMAGLRKQLSATMRARVVATRLFAVSMAGMGVGLLCALLFFLRKKRCEEELSAVEFAYESLSMRAGHAALTLRERAAALIAQEIPFVVIYAHVENDRDIMSLYGAMALEFAASTAAMALANAIPIAEPAKASSWPGIFCFIIKIGADRFAELRERVNPEPVFNITWRNNPIEALVSYNFFTSDPTDQGDAFLNWLAKQDF